MTAPVRDVTPSSPEPVASSVWSRGHLWLAAAVLAVVFYGDLDVGITIPLAVLLLPAALVLRLRHVPFPRGAWLGLAGLAVTLLCVVVQAGLGFGPRGRGDLVVYLPLVYALVTIVSLAGADLRDRTLRTVTLAGCVIAGSNLLAALLFAPTGTYALPGQNPVQTLVRQAEMRERLECDEATRPAAAAETRPVPAAGTTAPPEETAATPVEPATVEPATADSRLAPEVLTPEPDLDPRWKSYYTVKNRARTALGQSNYLAVMFVFLFNVLLYAGSRWAVLPATLTVLTFSRSGVALLALSWLLRVFARRGHLRPFLMFSAAAGVGAAILLFVFWDQVSNLPGMESLGARAWFLTNALEPIAAHPWFGAPRSEVMRQFGYPITWTPHTAILHLIVLFGVVGATAYVVYLGAVLRTVGARARTSPVWQGVFAALCVTLLWSTVEIIVLSPAFEILTAATFAVALNPTGALRSEPPASGETPDTGR